MGVGISGCLILMSMSKGSIRSSFLEEMDSEAEDKVNELKIQLGGGVHQKLVDTLFKQVGEFEFEDAHETLSELRKSLEAG